VLCTASTQQRDDLATSLHSDRPFGNKSLLAVGDLFQLPAVEKYRFKEQVYLSTLWPAFRFLELTEQCRQRGTSERRFAETLSRVRHDRGGLGAARDARVGVRLTRPRLARVLLLRRHRLHEAPRQAQLSRCRHRGDDAAV